MVPQETNRTPSAQKTLLPKREDLRTQVLLSPVADGKDPMNVGDSIFLHVTQEVWLSS